MKLLTISGSARRDSVNTALLLGLKDVAPEGVVCLSLYFKDAHHVPLGLMLWMGQVNGRPQ